MTPPNDRPRALDGIRVVDLTTVLMGPLACRMLADHGADVVQVVSPSTPDAFSADASGIGGIALDIHRNKRSVQLDLKSEPGRRAMWDLIGTADVLVTNMRAAALARLGLSAAGADGEYRQQPVAVAEDLQSPVDDQHRPREALEKILYVFQHAGLPFSRAGYPGVRRPCGP